MTGKIARYRYFFVCIVAVICAAAVTGCGTKTVNDTDIVMEIVEQPVAKAEYQMILSGYESEVKRQYTTDEANQKNFWNAEFSDGKPIEKIMRLAREDLVYKKTIAQFASEAGIAIAADYASIQKQMEEQNTERGNKAAAGEVVYGLTSFGIEDYYSYIYTQLEYEVTENLKKKQDISDEELMQIYQENIEEYTSEVSVRTLIAEMPASAGMELAGQAASAMEEETNPEVLAEKFPEISFYELKMSTLNTEAGRSGAYEERWQAALVMEEGEICDPFYIGENIMTLRCLDREEQAVTPFEDIKGVLESEVKTRLAKEEIAEKAAEAKVTCQEDVLRQAAMEILEAK